MIARTVERAWRIAAERGWAHTYWAIDLHGVCLAETAAHEAPRWISEEAVQGLTAIASDPGNKIILWSSLHRAQYADVLALFAARGIPVLAINDNPEVASTERACFDRKFHFNILLDDKAGFDPASDWGVLAELLRARRAALHGGPE